jgi:hypothetical protein
MNYLPGVLQTAVGEGVRTIGKDNETLYCLHPDVILPDSGDHSGGCVDYGRSLRGFAMFLILRQRLLAHTAAGDKGRERAKKGRHIEDDEAVRAAEQLWIGRKWG